MAAVPPITNSLSAPPSSTLVLPPSAQPALGLPPADSTQASNQATAATQSASTQTTADNTAVSTASAPTSPLSSTTQPLAVVLDALATAGVDAAVNQEILAPAVGQPAGSFSIFMEQLFTALAAQSAAAEQSAQSQAAQQATPVANQTPSTTTVTAFTTHSPGAAANSTLEIDVQNLAQTVNARSTNATLAEASPTDTTALTPLQQSFEQFVADVGGTPNSTTLGGFLQALATNLHTVQTPLGNIVNSQT